MPRTRAGRAPLTRDRVVAAASDVADAVGTQRLTMRLVADRLDVEAMALYRHVADKDDLLDALAERVLDRLNDAAAQLPGPAPGTPWTAVARERVLVAREVLLRHPWAPRLVHERGTMGPATLRWFDDLSAVLFTGGCSADLVHHAMHALGTRAIGYNAELLDVTPTGAEQDGEEMLSAMSAMSETYPAITRMVAEIAHDASTTLGWCDDQAEFEFGLDILLEGIERRRAAGGDGPPSGATGLSP
ncbi:TetR/AcrR family transcriptional regulator C-terminal domain-containing protein [Serinicoccus kebangsaanensis]|uniref:TetR/AcrR family transcriptional regulator C-terminal domain-containing protein n=1 Tax=Serinicoccus kebangsaanensis TaxID=2602069 RepID=UPI00124DDB9B|nr:TetR/AcrR family transcriptional regulator C-terminal domain-containing protein [Serinicoccus kebangsaanensis]